MYKLYKCGINNEETGVMLIGENSVTSFPADPDNTDYQAYLKFLAEGGTPLPADEVTA
jgi:hypothetical protein